MLHTEQPASTSSPTNREWWRDSVIYQIYPRSFASSGGPVGDLPGITERLTHVAQLGADAVWISPFYRSPQNDGGYDVADYRDVDPRFGSLADADALITHAHDLGLRVIVDLVPNHTSDEHPWFREALEAGPGSPERDRYWFRESAEIPNNWTSVFGGPAWTRVSDRPDAPGSSWENDQQWYLHLFDTTQPDLNWENPEVRDEFHSILRFWLDRGVDGFRIDVAHGLVKEPGLPNFDGWVSMVGGADGYTPMFDQPGVHEIFRGWNAVLKEYPRDCALVAEAWVSPEHRLVQYVRPDEMQQAFNFEFLSAQWDAAILEDVIGASYAANDAVGAPTTWVMSNHDVVRHASRLGLALTGKGPNGIGADDEHPDPALGLRRAKAATLLTLGLAGSVYLYQGEELGLPEHMELPDEVRQDPTFARTQGLEKGRDGQRVPLPWHADKPGFGFSPDGATWLPQPEEWSELAVDVQETDPNSTLNFYKRAIDLRRTMNLGFGNLQWVDLGEEALAFLSVAPEDIDRGDLMSITTFSRTMQVPEGWTVVLASSPLNGNEIGTDTTVWLTRS